MKDDTRMAQEFPGGSSHYTVVKGVTVVHSPGNVVIEIKTAKCALSVGRLAALVAFLLAFLLIAGFFAIGIIYNVHDLGPWFFTSMFLLFAAVVAVSCLATIANERIVVTSQEVDFETRLGPLFWHRHFQREWLCGMSLGHCVSPGDGPESIKTLSIFYRPLTRKVRRRVIVGYLLSGPSQRALYETLGGILGVPITPEVVRNPSGPPSD